MQVELAAAIRYVEHAYVVPYQGERHDERHEHEAAAIFVDRYRQFNAYRRRGIEPCSAIVVTGGA